MPDEALAQLSQILLDLYDTAAPADGDAFRLWALERLKPWLPFSSAAWAYGVMTAKGVVLHHISLLGLPPAFADAVRATASIDRTSKKMAAASGKSFVHTRRHYPPEMLRLAADPNDLHSSIEGMMVDPSTSLFGSVCLFRTRDFSRFSERERTVHESLMPHWLKAPSRRLINAVSAAEADARGEIAAVSDLNGVLEAAGNAAIQLLRREWPDWQGGTLPADLLGKGNTATKSSRTGSGKHIAWRLNVVDRRLVVYMRPHENADKLGERQREVAELLIQGLTLKEISTKLCVAESTVRNHRDSIYQKLHVSNRLALRDALHRLDPAR